MQATARDIKTDHTNIHTKERYLEQTTERKNTQIHVFLTLTDQHD